MCIGSITTNFLKFFFPFVLYKSIKAVDFSKASSKNQRNQLMNDFVNKIIQASVDLRKRARMISDKTSVGNLCPLLLPVRNFTDPALENMLKYLYNKVGSAPELDKFLNSQMKTLSHNFLSKPPNDNRSCFCDRDLYFKSPGKNRHGYFRHHVNEDHKIHCLLNAKSRLGGYYDYKFHYDCEPVRKLKSTYPNCHNDDCRVQKGYLNIFPNDFIR